MRLCNLCLGQPAVSHTLDLQQAQFVCVCVCDTVCDKPLYLFTPSALNQKFMSGQFGKLLLWSYFPRQMKWYLVRWWSQTPAARVWRWIVSPHCHHGEFGICVIKANQESGDIWTDKSTIFVWPFTRPLSPLHRSPRACFPPTECVLNSATRPGCACLQAENLRRCHMLWI